MADLVPLGVQDGGWKDAWVEGLHKATGILVLFSNLHRENCDNPNSALRFEAEQILAHCAECAQKGKTFHIHVMDPGEADLGAASLHGHLKDKVPQVNFIKWRKFLGQAALHGAAVFDTPAFPEAFGGEEIIQQVHSSFEEVFQADGCQPGVEIFVGTTQEFDTDTTISLRECNAVAWFGLGAQINAKDNTCYLVERITRLSEKRPENCPELVVVLLKRGGEWVANELVNRKLAKCAIWCTIDDLDSAQGFIIQQHLPFLNDLLRLIGTAKPKEVCMCNVEDLFHRWFTGKRETGIVFASTTSPISRNALHSPSCQGQPPFTRLTKSGFSTSGQMSCNLSPSFDSSSVQGICTVDIAHYGMLAAIRKEMETNVHDRGPILIPVFADWAKGLMDTTVLAQTRGLLKAICMQCTSSSIKRPFQFAKCARPDLPVEDVLAWLKKECSGNMAMHHGIVWLNAVLETDDQFDALHDALIAKSWSGFGQEDDEVQLRSELLC